MAMLVEETEKDLIEAIDGLEVERWRNERVVAVEGERWMTGEGGVSERIRRLRGPSMMVGQCLTS